MERIKDALRRGVDVRQLAYACGVSVQSVEKVKLLMIEHGELKP